MIDRNRNDSLVSQRVSLKGLLVRTAATLVVACLVLGPAHAFKVDTHVWIAQQVINDLETNADGTLTILVGPIARKVVVPAHVRAAILSHPEFFRMGSIGPDALPGIFEGQMSIHPGKDQWGVGDWLRLLFSAAANVPRAEEERRGQAIAFAYGFAVHAASDIFAHTYVNGYAGDIYALSDGEIDVELRHFLLEGFISEHLPPFVDGKGSRLGAASALIRKHGALAVPTDFLYDLFVADPQGAARLNEGGAPLFAQVHKLNQAIEDLTKPGGVADEIHRRIQQFIVTRLTGVTPSTADVDKLTREHQKVLDWGNKGIDELQKGYDEYTSFVKGTIVYGDKKIAEMLSAVDKILSRAREALSKWQSAREEVANLARRFDEPIKKIRELNEQIDKLCLKIGGKKLCGPETAVRKATLEGFIKTHNVTVATLRHSLDVQRTIENESLNIWQNLNRDLSEDISAIHKAALEFYTFEIGLTQSVVDLNQKFNSNANPIKNTLLGWRDDNVRAIKGYFVANAEAIAAAMEGADALKPLNKWVECDALVFAGVPREALQGGCSVAAYHQQIQELLRALDPVTDIIEDKKEELKQALHDAAIRGVGELLNTDIKRLLDVVRKRPSAAELNAQFLRSPDNQNLLVVGDMAERATRDMRVDANKKLDPKGFSPVYNAIVLSKLALLDARSLNRLLGSNLYPEADDTNVMIRFAKSIDGDHQWLPVPPPYARASGNHEVMCVGYGYDSGFPLWDGRPNEMRKRRNLFRQLFKGPISPNLTPILPRNYPYRPTVGDPFPDNPLPQACADDSD